MKRCPDVSNFPQIGFCTHNAALSTAGRSRGESVKKFVIPIIVFLLIAVSCTTPTAPADSNTAEKRGTPVPAPTISSLPLYSISGRIFFDYNANGEMEAEEPPFGFIPINLNEYAYATLSDEDGYFQIKDVPAGTYDIRIESPEMVDPSYQLRYITFSNERIKSIENPITIQIDSDVNRDFGLTQGFITMPIPCEMINGTTKFIDLDHRLGSIRGWDGITSGASLADQHQGIDYPGERFTPILAAAPGIVIRSAEEGDETKSILIMHDLGDEKFVTGYHHNDSVTVVPGDKVKRGQEIALMGDSGVESVHVHFELWPMPVNSENTYAAFRDYIFNPDLWTWIPDPSGGEIPSGLDFYQDQKNKNTRSYWTAHNKPKCISAQ